MELQNKLSTRLNSLVDTMLTQEGLQKITMYGYKPTLNMLDECTAQYSGYYYLKNGRQLIFEIRCIWENETFVIKEMKFRTITNKISRYIANPKIKKTKQL